MLTEEQADRVRTAHHRAVKAAQQMTAATPGTETMKAKERAWDRAEDEFKNLIDWLID
jgi:hypothetical protein